MVRVYLREATGYSGCTVTNQKYEPCSLFHKYTHTRTGRIGVDYIYVYKEYNLWKMFVNYFTLDPYYSFPDQGLERSEVYYNVFDTKREHPLLLVLFFKQGKLPNVRYSPSSEFIPFVRGGKTIQLGTLKSFSRNYDKELLETLILENDYNNRNLTYQIDFKNAYSTIGQYNIGRVSVTPKEFIMGHGADETHGFYKYTHSPYDKKPKVSFVLYNNQVPLLWSGSHGKLIPINEIQNQVYSSISMYYSSKVKEPLMFELVKRNEATEEYIYYFAKRHDKHLYWQVLDALSYKAFLGKHTTDIEIHNNLVSNENELLLAFLTKVESYFIKTLVIILDKFHPYSESDAIFSLRRAQIDTYHYMLINKYTDISVNNVSQSCYELAKHGYIAYEHDFSKVFRFLQPHELVRLKFTRYRTETVVKGDVISFYLDYRGDYETGGGSYYGGPAEIQIASANNLQHNYIWYRHSSYTPLLTNHFQFIFDGQTLNLDNDLGESYNKNLINVYYKLHSYFRFVLVVLTTTDFKKVRYLTYSDFRKNVFSRTTVKLSSLYEINANITTTVLPSGNGYVLDDSLSEVLNQEFEVLKADSSDVTDILYHHPGYNKVYVYSYFNDNRPLMLCYRNAYSMYYLGRNSAQWKKVDGIETCICNDDQFSDQSKQKLLQTLDETAILLGLKEPERRIDTIKPVETIDHSREMEKEAEMHQSVVDRAEPVVIDLSLTDTKYDSGRVIVGKKQIYNNSNLFCFYTHSLVNDGVFVIESLLIKVKSEKKTIMLDSEVENVRSIDAYFNIFIPDVPIFLSITSVTKTNYYKFQLESDKSYSIIEDDFTHDLAERLIKYNDTINNTLTYELDKTTTSIIEDGYNDAIKLSKEHSSSKGYTVFTHSPVSVATKGFVIFNQNLLSGLSHAREDPFNEIQYKQYKYVKVYFLPFDYNLPLLIEVNQSSSTTHFLLIEYKNRFYWRKEFITLPNPETILSKLNEIYYYLKSSIIIEIDKGGGSHTTKDTVYPIKIIENKIDSQGYYQKSKYMDGHQVTPTKNIVVSHPSSIKDSTAKNYSSFIYVSHTIPDFSINVLENSDSNISGFRFFISGSDMHSEEVFLFDNKSKTDQSKDKILLYNFTKPPLNKIFVFFYGQDPRPLLLCFNNKGYKRINNEDNAKWVIVPEIKRCTDDPQIFITLRDIYGKMEKKIVFLMAEKSEKNIIKSHDKPFGNFIRNTYKPNVHQKTGPFILPKKSLLSEETKSFSNIEKLLEMLNDKTFDIVNVYKKSSGSSLKDILLFEFIDQTTKTHFQRLDLDGKYWVEEEIQYINDITLQKQLPSIQSNFDKTIVYEIDKLDLNYNNYVFLKKDFGNPSKDFNKFSHSPNYQHNGKNGFVLFKGAKLLKKISGDRFQSITDIQNVSYKMISVFFGSKKRELPLMIEFILSNSNSERLHYRLKIQNRIFYWEKIQFLSHGTYNRDLIRQLKIVELDLIGSVIIIMDKREDNYGELEARKVLNQSSSKLDLNLHPMSSHCVSVNNVTSQSQGSCLKDTGFGIYEHNINSCVKQTDICGIRFFIPTEKAINNYNEINLYNSSNVLESIFYIKPNVIHNVYIYFFNGMFMDFNQSEFNDPRPLLISYGGNVYRPKKLNNLDYKSHVYVDYTSWVQVDGVYNSFCNSEQKSGQNRNLLDVLIDVYGDLNPIQINPRMIPEISRSIIGPDPIELYYNLDKFGSTTIQIKIRSENLKCYRKYTYYPYDITYGGSNYRLGKLIYTDNNGTFPINYSSASYDYRPLLSLSVFYYVFDYDHNYALLILLRFAKGDSWLDDNSKFLDCYKLSSKFSDRNKKWQSINEHVDEKDFLKNLNKLYENSVLPEDFTNDFDQLDSMARLQPDFQTQTNELDDFIEEKLYSIRTKLEIEFSEEQKHRHLFDPKNCYEDSNTSTIIKATSGTLGTVATVGTTVGVTAATRPEWFIPVIRALV